MIFLLVFYYLLFLFFTQFIFSSSPSQPLPISNHLYRPSLHSFHLHYFFISLGNEVERVRLVASQVTLDSSGRQIGERVSELLSQAVEIKMISFLLFCSALNLIFVVVIIVIIIAVVVVIISLFIFYPHFFSPFSIQIF